MRWIGLLFVAIITFVIILLVKNPDVVKKFWLWAIGLSGFIIHIAQLTWNFLKQFFTKKIKSLTGKKTNG